MRHLPDFALHSIIGRKREMKWTIKIANLSIYFMPLLGSPPRPDSAVLYTTLIPQDLIIISTPNYYQSKFQTTLRFEIVKLPLFFRKQKT